MKPVVILWICLVLFWSGSGLFAEKGPKETDYSEAIGIIDIWLEAQREYDRIPGISVAVVKDQELIWSKGYGLADLNSKTEAAPDTIYSICSISKLFTSIAVMQLRDAGKLRLEDRIADLLPWFNLEQQYPEGGPITVRSLLTHSSGLPRESIHGYWTGPDFPFPSSKELRESLENQKTLYPASTYFQYSNLGLSLLGDVVARVSGMDFEEYVDKYILTPLRLSDTRPELPGKLWGGKLAVGYSSMTREGTRNRVALFQARGIAPAAGFSSTVLDLARFASWQFRLLKKGGTEILRATTLREMQRVHWMDPDWKATWGLGFSVYKVDGRTFVGHAGTCPGYRSILVMDPEKKWAYVVMTNANGPYPAKYTTGVREILAKAGRSSAAGEKSGVDLDAYAGIYDPQPMSSETAVMPWQGKLAVFVLPVDSPARRMILLEHVRKDIFRSIRPGRKPGPEVIFQRNEDGKVVRMISSGNIRKKIK
jgi:CubicO group peptidase (beta-lactamase class C family)